MANGLVARLEGVRADLESVRAFDRRIFNAKGSTHIPDQDVENGRVVIEATIPCDPARRVCGGNVFRKIFSIFVPQAELEHKCMKRCAGCPHQAQYDGSIRPKTSC